MRAFSSGRSGFWSTVRSRCDTTVDAPVRRPITARESPTQAAQIVVSRIKTATAVDPDSTDGTELAESAASAASIVAFIAEATCV